MESSAPHQGAYRNTSRPATLEPVNLGAAALAYASRGIPVFRLRPGTKEPFHGSRGFYDATTDPETIRRLWRQSPDANIGIPTGKASGLLVLDVDRPAGLQILEDEHGELPATRTHSTGSGGMHYLYRFPSGSGIRNSAGKLAHGLDVRGEGGYIVAPPSRTTRPYEVLDHLPAVDTPAWLLEALTRPHSAAGDRTSTVTPMRTNVDLDGPEIPAGERNWTLYRIGSRLRGYGHDESSILEELSRANLERCSTPLAEEELSRIARSAARHNPGNASPEVSPEVLEALDAIEEDVMRCGWPGMGGKSERDAMISLVRLARMHGTIIPAGVRISVDVRTLALMTSVSKRSLLDNRKNGERVPGIVSRLKARGRIRSDNANRNGKEAGAIVLLHPAQAPRARLHHSTTTEPLRTTEKACGATLRAPRRNVSPTAPRLRWSRPVFDGPERVGTISRLGKSKGEIIDHLERAGGTATVEELADAAGTSRVRDLRRRHLEPLAEAGVVECSGDAVSLTPEWLDALNERRDLDGELADHRRDMARYDRERDAYRNRDQRPADSAPTADEMREHRESYPERRRAAIEQAIAGLFAARPEYRARRVGQIVCKLHDFLPGDFSPGVIGYPKDHEVETILDGEAAA